MAPGRRTILDAFAKLLAHDLRLGWRDFRSSFRLLDDRALACVVVLLMAVMHAAAWSLGSRLVDLGADDPAGRAVALGDLKPGVAFVMLLMVAQTLNSLTKTLYGRGDLDLLLSSPFPVSVVLVVRVLAVALGALASAAIFVVPVADAGLLHGAWRSLALFPTLVAGALLASALSLTLVMGMFAVLGPRRTRLMAQIAATFIGGGFMIWLQIGRFVPHDLLPTWPGEGGTVFWLASALDELGMLPVRAASGDLPSLVVFVVLSVAAYLAATLAFGRRFAAGVSSAASLAVVAHKARPTRGRDRRFATRLATSVRNKEWRLIRRDPWLLSQLLLQILYMTPMVVMLWHGAGPGSLDVALAPMIVVVSYQVSASMTWLSLSGEDAPELLATAPVTRWALDRHKLLSVAELTLMLAILPLLWLATISLVTAGLTALLSALAVSMAMMLSLWHTKPAKRSSFAARHRESKLLALMEMVMSMLMGVAAALLAVHSPWTLVPLGIALVILAVNRPRRERLRPSADRDPTAGREPRQQAA